MRLIWIEDPTRRYGEEARKNYIRIKESLDQVLLSYGGDTMDNRFEYKEWIDRKAMDIVQPDAGVMGLTEAWYVSRIAHLQDQQCAPHNWHGALMTISNAHLAAGIPNLIMLEANQTYNPLRTDLLKEPLVIRDGFLELPGKPGLGVEVIDDPAEKYPFIPGTYDKPRPS
jgi:galactonate dehydratase